MKCFEGGDTWRYLEQHFTPHPPEGVVRKLVATARDYFSPVAGLC